MVETFGESPLVSSDYAAATVRGFHGSLAQLPGKPAPADFGVASCLKHYLGYGAVQGGKDYAYVDLTERSIREFHLPPFAAGVAAGAPSVMPAFTTGPGGVPMSANKRMLQDVLRGELGFNGVLVSDYAGITEMRNHGTAADDLEAAVQALRDGTMTVDMEDGVYYAQLARAVTGRPSARRRNRSRSPARAGVQTPSRPVREALCSRRPREARAGVRRRIAPPRARSRASPSCCSRTTRSCCRSRAKRILVTGPLADAREDLLGPWHARGEAKDVVSVLAGIRERAASGKNAVNGHLCGRRADSTAKAKRSMATTQRIAAAVSEARNSDLIIAVVGERESHERRSEKSRAPRSARQPAGARRCAGRHRQARGRRAHHRARPRRARRWSRQSGALVHAFFPGIEGGRALADVLFGDYNPGGKEPVTWPRSVGQLPIHHYDPPNGRPNIPERGDYKAHWLDEPDEPLFAFGFGLSYTRFDLTALELPAAHRPRGHADGPRTPDQPRQPRRRRSAAALHPAARRARGDRQTTAGIPARASGGGRVARHRVHAAREEPRGARRAGSLGSSQSGIYEVTLGTSAQGGLTGTFELAN